MEPVVGGDTGNQGPVLAPIGRRFAAAIIDLIIIPSILGIVIGLGLLTVSDTIRSIILIIVNIGWLLFRDSVYSPGRAMVGLKLVSLTGPKVTLAQAFIRNVLIEIPFVLILGYPAETIMLLTKKERIMDGPAKTRVILA